MIKLSRLPKPIELTTAKQRKLTNVYIREKKNVWSKSYIRKTLLNMSDNKCAYCETVVGEESKYMEVEHFYPKETYPSLVVDWANLLPSCKKCNVKKGAFDTGKNPFIHPVNDYPQNHLTLQKAARIVGIDDKGKETIHKLDLNGYDLSRKPRIKVINKVIQELEDLYDEITNRFLTNSLHFQKKVQRKMKAILQAATPRSAYSAYVASELLNHS